MARAIDKQAKTSGRSASEASIANPGEMVADVSTAATHGASACVSGPTNEDAGIMIEPGRVENPAIDRRSRWNGGHDAEARPGGRALLRPISAHTAIFSRTQPFHRAGR
jgi:hypothetical protein